MPRLAHELVEQCDDLGADRHVEHRDRLVGDQDLRLRRQRPRDHHALALPAGELVRQLVEVLRRPGSSRPSPAARRRVRGPAARPCRGSCAAAGQRVRDGAGRVERGERVLEDQLHVPPVACAGPGGAAGRPACPGTGPLPLVGRSTPVTIRAIVVLPEPLWPTSALTRPGRSANETSSTASVVSYVQSAPGPVGLADVVDHEHRLVVRAAACRARPRRRPRRSCVDAAPRLPARGAAADSARPAGTGPGRGRPAAARGASVRHASTAIGQRGSNRQPAWARDRSGGRPGMNATSTTSSRGSAYEPSSPAVYGCVVRGDASRPAGWSSTSSPPYITITRSASLHAPCRGRG